MPGWLNIRNPQFRLPLFQFVTAAGAFAFAALLFTLLQSESIYHSTLGKITHTFERTPWEQGYQVNEVQKPFTTFEDEHLRQWDAAIYECIRYKGYKIEFTCFGEVRGAFFPAFPAWWRLSGVTPVVVCFLNLFLFVFALGWLQKLLQQEDLQRQLIHYVLLLAMPAAVIYFMPYSEATFLLGGVVMTAGFLRGSYALFFAGAFLLASTRPASIFVLLALMATEILMVLQGKKLKNFLQDAGKWLLPFAAAYLAVILLQFKSSGSWTLFFDAQARWMGKWGIPDHIEDWSFESYGISVFVVFFICFPALIYCLYRLVQPFFGILPKPVFNTGPEGRREFLFTASAAYFAGMMVFTFFTSDGNLHSFMRFTLCSPAFFTLVFLLPEKIKNLPPLLPVAWTVVSAVSWMIFLANTGYGASRLSFAFFGSWLCIGAFLFLLWQNHLPLRLQVPLVLILTAANLLWNVYLFNAFLCNGWIFA